MNFNWVSNENVLLLNPRLQPEVKQRYEYAWKNLVESSFEGEVGIATSGSSGEQGRLIAVSKSALMVSAQAVNERLQVTKVDVWYKTLPNFHVGGLGILARAHLSGSRVVEALSDRWDAVRAHKELTDCRATITAMVPTQLFDLVQLGLHAPPSLRAIVIGGGRLEAAVQARALALGWPALPSYGLTECCSQVCTALNATDSRLVPLNHVDLRIGAEDRIEVSSASLLTGQVVFDSKMNAHFTDPKIDDWFTTEDRGTIDSQGVLTVLGRAQDFVKVGGEGVIMSRLEEQMDRLRLQTKFVHDAVVLAAADDRLGAKIVLISNTDQTAALVEAFNAAVMPFERIRSVHRVDALPRSALGKLLRTQALALVGLKAVTDF